MYHETLSPPASIQKKLESEFDCHIKITRHKFTDREQPMRNLIPHILASTDNTWNFCLRGVDRKWLHDLVGRETFAGMTVTSTALKGKYLYKSKYQTCVVEK